MFFLGLGWQARRRASKLLLRARGLLGWLARRLV